MRTVPYSRLEIVVFEFEALSIMSNSTSLHEDATILSKDLIDRHRAIASIMEELEAVDWYDQRAQAATDPELRDVLVHNRDEEKEHAAMAIEWLRRHDPVFEKHLRTYLFTEHSIVALEAVNTADSPDSNAADASLGIGSLRRSVGL